MSHYKYLDKYFKAFFILAIENEISKTCNKEEIAEGLILAHGDKCYQYMDEWLKEKLDFNRCVAIYLLTYVYPFSTKVRQVRIYKAQEGFTDIWVEPCKWVIDNYEKFESFLLNAEKQINGDIQ